jgi:hypothetical protein
MLSYRDMTFCPYWKDCKSADMCHRPLTAKVQQDAERFGMPLSMFAERPACWSLKETEAVVVVCQ